MDKKPDDRLKPTAAPAGDDPEPKIYLMVDGQKFVRPGLETYFADTGNTANVQQYKGNCSCNPVVGTYCSCNKVCSCNPQCSCQGHSSSSSSSGGGGSYCSCVPVH
ncbi:MAG TPA: hypothetical protein VN426_02710 [Syntrophomonadaceae bacterium]|nr:hypothetical protein [Syntrophomonadaceae bacterium]